MDILKVSKIHELCTYVLKNDNSKYKSNASDYRAYETVKSKGFILESRGL